MPVALTSGTRLGHYEIIAAIGAGGMGAVYRARDPRLDREVAIKVLSPDLAQDAGAPGRFEREAMSVAKLSHPNILAIFEFAQESSLRDWADSPGRARIFVTEVDDPENFGVVLYDDEKRVADIVEKAGVVDTRFDSPPSSHAVVGLYCYPPDVFDVIDTLAPSTRGELEITDVNRHYALVSRLDASEVVGWWEDAGKHWRHLADIGRRIDETGANKRDPE